jgi:hypothetical protein
VRAGMLRHPRDYPWSSYAARGAIDRLADRHQLFDRLGVDPVERQKACLELFRAALDPDFVDQLRAATNGGWALGGARFKRQIAASIGRRVEGAAAEAQAGSTAVKSTLTPFHFLITPAALIEAVFQLMPSRRAILSAHHLRIKVCSPLSTDHDLNLLKKHCPRRISPFTEATLATTFSIVLLPTVNDLIRSC